MKKAIVLLIAIALVMGMWDGGDITAAVITAMLFCRELWRTKEVVQSERKE